MNNTNKPLLSFRFERALVYATQIHSNQIRKGSKVPYISHLLSVTALVLEDGGDEDEAIAALLHDAIEDQSITSQQIHDLFGEKVASIVSACTESETLPKPAWKERKLASIEHLRDANASVRRVMLADKLHNLRSILSDWYRLGDLIWDRFKGGQEGTLWYFRSLVAAERESGSSFLGQELERSLQLLESASLRH